MSHAPDSAFDPVEEVIAEIAAGRPVIVTDDEDRENEGDLIMAAAKATPETITMMIRHCSGIICVPMLEPQLRRLGLGPMVARNREVQRTDFTVSVDAAQGIGTGISAADRTMTIRLLADPATTPEQLVQPGHVFPLRARPGGVFYVATPEGEGTTAFRLTRAVDGEALFENPAHDFPTRIRYRREGDDGLVAEVVNHARRSTFRLRRRSAP